MQCNDRRHVHVSRGIFEGKYSDRNQWCFVFIRQSLPSLPKYAIERKVNSEIQENDCVKVVFWDILSYLKSDTRIHVDANYFVVSTDAGQRFDSCLLAST